MRIDVRYFSKNGGTKKLAEAIAKAVDAECKTVDQPLEKYADVVFLGASVYGGKPDPAVTKFIADNARNIGKIVVFGSACTGKSTFPAIKSAAAAQAVIGAILGRGLLQRVQEQGAKLQSALEAELGQHPHVGDIRGRRDDGDGERSSG